MTDSDDALLRFLAEMLHPTVRTNFAEVERLHDFLNQTLVHDGYEIVQVDAVSGAPVFAGRRIDTGVPGAMKNLIFAADRADNRYVTQVLPHLLTALVAPSDG